MSPKYVVGVDGGTGGIRAGLFEVATGTPIGFADCPYDTEYPQPGWAEQNPSDWWAGLGRSVKQVGRCSPPPPPPPAPAIPAPAAAADGGYDARRLADIAIARRVIGCRATQVKRGCKMRVETWRAVGLADIARRVIGCRSTQAMRV